MILGLASGLLRTTLAVLGGVGAFVSFGRIASHLIGSPALQVAVATAMGLLAIVVIHRVVAISEIPRIIAHVTG